MNAMVPGLKGSKMSSSDSGSKIDFLDTPTDVKKKLKDAACIEGVVEENGVLAFAKAVLFPISRLRNESKTLDATPVEIKGLSKPYVSADAPDGTLFSIVRPDKYGGSLHYATYEALEADYADKKLHPLDLKNGVADAINALLEPIQREFNESEEFRKVEELAYPKEKKPEVKKKEKKVNPRHLQKGEAPAQGPAGQEAKAAQQGEKENETFVKAAQEGIQNLSTNESS
ncbi:hypothetical protein L7F22_037695 [Adiantum nelumboides]|nr:hypothetical protein [Adiantum nelumboides]